MKTLSEAVAQYDEMLDECYPTTEIMGVTMYPSQILREVDPIAYRVNFHDWLDGEGVDIDDLDDDYDLP